MRSNYLADVQRAEMVALASAFAPDDGLHATALPGLQLIRASAPAQPLPAMYEPGLVFVVQGRKRAVLGDQVLHYDPFHYLLVSVTALPRAQILEASPERPYLCVRLDLDPRELGELLLEAPATMRTDALPRALRVTAVPTELGDAMLRLLRLLRTPEDLPVLGPLALREIQWRVLTGELGEALRAVATAGGRAQRIARAVRLIETRFAEPVRIEEVAQAAHMSVSSLHHHFKHATSMSPLQYQKQLRLHHARRMMLTEGLDAAAAAHRVGYESPSQFSREYRRLFGGPPRAQVAGLRSAAVRLDPDTAQAQATEPAGAVS